MRRDVFPRPGFYVAMRPLLPVRLLRPVLGPTFHVFEHFCFHLDDWAVGSKLVPYALRPLGITARLYKRATAPVPLPD